jgi:ankyrin repeat protein
LNPSIKRYKYDKMKEIFESEFPVDHPITDTSMSALSLMCSLPEPTPNHRVHSKKLLDTIFKFNPDINHKDSLGRCPIHFASRIGNITSVQELIEKGIPQKLDNGEMSKPDLSLEINPVSIGNVSPLMYAVENNRIEIYKMLIENGADLTIKDIQGHDAYHYIKLSHPKSELVGIVKDDLIKQGIYDGDDVHMQETN